MIFSEQDLNSRYGFEMIFSTPDINIKSGFCREKIISAKQFLHYKSAVHNNIIVLKIYQEIMSENKTV